MRLTLGTRLNALQTWLLGLAIVLSSALASAFTVSTPYDQGYLAKATWTIPGVAGGESVLLPTNVEHSLAGGGGAYLAKTILEGGFPTSGANTFTFVLGTEAPGHLTVRKYTAYAANDQCGADLLAEWRDYMPDGTAYRWIQIIVTNRPRSPHTSQNGYVDGPTDDGTPYYYNDVDEALASSDPTSAPYCKFFSDAPRRPHDPALPETTWLAYLFLTSSEFCGGNAYTVTIHDGIKWGWQTSSYLGQPPGGGGEDSWYDLQRAVPEPATSLIFGVLAVGFRRRRRLVQ